MGDFTQRKKCATIEKKPALDRAAVAKLIQDPSRLIFENIDPKYLSTNAGGMRAVKYGVTRDYVRGLEIVTADGTVLTVGGKNVKDATGLSLKNLIVGVEGTLAVITKCILKLIPKPEASVSVLVPYPDLKTGIGSVLSILRETAPANVAMMNRIKDALDPRHILNGQKSYITGEE